LQRTWTTLSATCRRNARLSCSPPHRQSKDRAAACFFIIQHVISFSAGHLNKNLSTNIESTIGSHRPFQNSSLVSWVGGTYSKSKCIQNVIISCEKFVFQCCFRSVKDLARLGLKNPTYISTDERAQHSTPSGLEQVGFAFVNDHIVCWFLQLWDFLSTRTRRTAF
jgi:hypothetical protein